MGQLARRTFEAIPARIGSSNMINQDVNARLSLATIFRPYGALDCLPQTAYPLLVLLALLMVLPCLPVTHSQSGRQKQKESNSNSSSNNNSRPRQTSKSTNPASPGPV